MSASASAAAWFPRPCTGSIKTCAHPSHYDGVFTGNKLYMKVERVVKGLLVRIQGFVPVAKIIYEVTPSKVEGIGHRRISAKQFAELKAHDQIRGMENFSDVDSFNRSTPIGFLFAIRTLIKVQKVEDQMEITNPKLVKAFDEGKIGPIYLHVQSQKPLLPELPPLPIQLQTFEKPWLLEYMTCR